MSSATLRFGGYQGAASVHTKALRILAERTEREARSVRVEVTENITALGRPASALLAMVEGGELDICYFASSYLAERVPALRALDLPFLFSNRQRAIAALEGELGERLAAAVEACTGFRVIGFWDNGFRHLSNAVRPIRTPTDCAGLRLRTLDSPLHQQIFRKLGFVPQFIDVKDLVAAVESRSIDAQENPLTNTLHFGLYRTHPHHSLTAHFYGVALLLANRRRYDQWSSDLRVALAIAAAAATARQRASAEEEDHTCLAQLRQLGAAIVGPAELDRAAFSAACAPIRDAEMAKLDPAIAACLAEFASH